MITSSFVRGIYAAVLISALPLTGVAKTNVATTPVPVAANQAAHLTNLKTRGATEIDRRLASLNTALAALQTSTKITSTDKTALASQIQDEVTALTSLKAKLAANTVLAEARADVASIATDYRVYALMLPKTRLVAAADRQTMAVTQLTDLSNKLETRLTAAKSNGKNVAALQTSLIQLKTQLATATTGSSGVVAKVLALQPSDVNANRTVLAGYRQALVTAQAELKAARTTAKTIVDGLAALR